MKLWVTTDCIPEWVELHLKRPTVFISRSCGYGGPSTPLPRVSMKRLLMGTGKKLPRHASKTILELEIEVKI